MIYYKITDFIFETIKMDYKCYLYAKREYQDDQEILDYVMKSNINNILYKQLKYNENGKFLIPNTNRNNTP